MTENTLSSRRKPTRCSDPVILDQWHPISSIDEIPRGRVQKTRLLGEPICYGMDDTGAAYVWYADKSDKDSALLRPDSIAEADKIALLLCHDHLWACLGDNPPATLFEVKELVESDRQNVPTGVFGVHVSAGRAIENFLDMGHFPFVHTGILGDEPHTEVKEYQVETSAERDEVLATQCKFRQPKATLAADGWAEVEYIYRVPHPNCGLLYKSSPGNPGRMDVIYMFLQPMEADFVRAHTGMCVIDIENSYEGIRAFQQEIFGQDKPILENQFPKSLPLDPRAETPIRADKVAIAYRRWLSDKGLRYGVLPVSA